MEKPEQLLLSLTAIFVLGVGSQWLAGRLKTPAILLLLTAGCLAGPVSGLIDPDAMFGQLLQPLISLSVGLILFEGGLSLRYSEFREIGRSLIGLLTVGVLITWIGTAFAARVLLGLPFSVSFVLGSILVVTGPTVIGPLLREIRPVGRVAAIAKWEGIVIDPIGASLAVLVFEAIEAMRAEDYSNATWNAIRGLLMTSASGLAIGGLAAFVLVWSLRKFWIPDHLHNPVALMFVIATFAMADILQHESGLLAVTVMGIVLANQSHVSVQRITEFKESLTVLLISVLFILLAARIPLQSLGDLGWRGAAFVLALLLIIRPLAVWMSTLGAGLTVKERLFLAWMAPRGIVAAAVASVFALRMGADGAPIAPATFLVILVTVGAYGLTAGPLARRMGLATARPHGLLIAGANRIARAIAGCLTREGFKVILIDTNYMEVQQARSEGVTVHYANILSEHVMENIDLGGIGRYLGLTANDEVNTLAAEHYRELLGRQNVYQLIPSTKGRPRVESHVYHFRGRPLFGPLVTFELLEEALSQDAVIKVTPLTEEFDFARFDAQYGPRAWILFVIEGEKLNIVTADTPLAPQPGQSLVCLVLPEGVSEELRAASGLGTVKSNSLPQTTEPN